MYNYKLERVLIKTSYITLTWHEVLIHEILKSRLFNSNADIRRLVVVT